MSLDAKLQSDILCGDAIAYPSQARPFALTAARCSPVARRRAPVAVSTVFVVCAHSCLDPLPDLGNGTGLGGAPRSSDGRYELVLFSCPSGWHAWYCLLPRTAVAARCEPPSSSIRERNEATNPSFCADLLVHAYHEQPEAAGRQWRAEDAASDVCLQQVNIRPDQHRAFSSSGRCSLLSPVAGDLTVVACVGRCCTARKTPASLCRQSPIQSRFACVLLPFAGLSSADSGIVCCARTAGVGAGHWQH